MISMDTKQEIYRRYFKEGDSERKIARDLRLHRDTVRRYLQQYLNVQKSKKNPADNQLALEHLVESAPSYNCSKRLAKRLTNPVIKQIDLLLSENDDRRQQGLHKQLRNKMDIWNNLQSQDFQIGYTTVCNYVRKKQLQVREAYIRQEYVPGEVCEFDWGEIHLYIQGRLKRFYMSAFTSAYSNYRFARLFVRQDSLAFMESHNLFFEHTRGVYQEMVYDNMRVAVSAFVGREKEPTQALLRMEGWFGFLHRFCNVRRGNEKGHVERSIDVIRHHVFSNKNDFDSFDQAQEYLIQGLQVLNDRAFNTQNASERFNVEQRLLWHYPGPMGCYITEMLKVDKYATFSYSTNRYSAPDHLVGERIEVKIYSSELRVYYQDALLATHVRNYGHGNWTVDINHYLRTFERKPGALAASTALSQNERLQAIFKRHFLESTNDFVHILTYCKENLVSVGRLEQAVENIFRQCPHDVSSDKIIALLGNKPSDESLSSVDVSVDTKRIDQSSQQILDNMRALTHQPTAYTTQA